MKEKEFHPLQFLCSLLSNEEEKPVATPLFTHTHTHTNIHTSIHIYIYVEEKDIERKMLYKNDDKTEYKRKQNKGKRNGSCYSVGFEIDHRDEFTKYSICIVLFKV